MNKVILSGSVAGKHVAEKFARITLKVNNSYIDVMFFGKMIDYANRLNENDKVIIEGMVKSNKYQNRKEHNIVASFVEYINKAGYSPQIKEETPPPTNADDVPF